MDEKDHSIFRFMELPDYVTLLGGISSILAVMSAVNQAFVPASMLLILSVFCDYFDGKIARRMNRKNTRFGETLDSVVDAVSFAAAPVFFGYSLGMRSPALVKVLLLFVSGCLLRLARFSCIKTEKGHFIGMPVTYNNLIFPAAYLLMHFFKLEKFLIPAFTFLFLSSTVLMTSRIKWRKF